MAGWLKYRLGYGVEGTVDSDNPAAPPQVVINAYKPVVAVLTSVPSTITETVLLATNPDRKAFTLWNNSTSHLYVKFGSGITTTFFNFKLRPWAYYESTNYIPINDVVGVWDVTNGTALVTEFS